MALKLTPSSSEVENEATNQQLGRLRCKLNGMNFGKFSLRLLVKLCIRFINAAWISVRAPSTLRRESGGHDQQKELT